VVDFNSSHDVILENPVKLRVGMIWASRQGKEAERVMAQPLRLCPSEA
jgi:hypothetical protein